MNKSHASLKNRYYKKTISIILILILVFSDHVMTFASFNNHNKANTLSDDTISDNNEFPDESSSSISEDNKMIEDPESSNESLSDNSNISISADMSDGSNTESENCVIETISTNSSDQEENTCGTTPDGFNYSFVQKNLYITGYEGNNADVVIPSTIDGTDVYGISRYAFKNKANITSIALPSNLSTVEEDAFLGCSALELLTVSSNIKALPLGLIGNPSHFSLVFSDNVTSIKNSLLSKSCYVTDIYISDTVNAIGSSAFVGCTSLKSVSGCKGLKTIGSEAFFNTGLQSISDNEGGSFFPNLETIGQLAFSKTNIESISISSGCSVSIGEKAFYNCDKLTRVCLGEGITTIKDSAFAYCNLLNNVSLSDSVSSIGGSAFANDPCLTKILLGSSVESIGESAFENDSSIEELVFPKTLSKIGRCFLKNCTGLKSVTIKSNLPAGDYFSSEPESTVGIPNGDALVSFFYNAGSDEEFVVIFEEGVTVIPDRLFATGHLKEANVHCKVSKVLFPSTLKEVQEKSFYHCYNLKEMSFIYDPPTFSNTCFEGVTATATYPNKSSWRSECRDYGGKITWIAVDPPEIPIISISLNKILSQLYCKEKMTLQAVLFPNTTTEGITWSADNPDLVNILVNDKDATKATIEARNTPGDVIVKVSSVSGNIYATCKISIIEPDKPFVEDNPQSGLDPRIIVGAYEELGKTRYINIYLIKGLSYALSGNRASAYPDYNSIIQVIKGYIIKAKSSGKTKIRKYYRDNDNILRVISYNALVSNPTIEKKKTVVVDHYSKIELSNVDLDYYNVYWYSSNPNIATVNQSGEVYGVARGKVKIIAYIGSKAFPCTVTVKDVLPVPYIPARDSTITLMPLESVTTKLPGNVKIKKAVWESANKDLVKPILPNGKEANYYQNDVVRLSPSGKITAIGSGTTTITVYTSKGSNTFSVSVNNPSERQIFINKGQSFNVKYTGVNVTGKNKAQWKTSDLSVAEISDKGKLKGISFGETELLCEYKPFGQGGFCFKSKVYVEDPLWSNEKIIKNGNKMSLTLKKGEKTKLSSSQIYQPVVWKSSKGLVGFADEFGMIRTIDKGTINMTTTINKKKYSIKLRVTP